jgi:N-acetylmuramoyl-L-alanine amidase
LSGKHVVVDAGHGGRDPGAVGVGPLREKAVNLSVARRLAWLLERGGAEVVTTRSRDVFIPLDDRANVAQRTRTDLFVSIHADAAPRADATGATVYIARDACTRSRRAATCLVNAFKRAGIACRGIRQAGFRVLVGHDRPAVLVECGYLTNRTEAHRLAKPSYQAHLATVIAAGIADHLRSDGSLRVALPNTAPSSAR